MADTKTNVFGTFLETISSNARAVNAEDASHATLGKTLDAVRSAIAQSPAAIGAAAGAVAGAVAGAGVQRPSEPRPVDEVFRALASRSSQQDLVSLQSLLPAAGNSLGDLLSILAQLESFDLIQRSGSTIKLTQLGIQMSNSMM